MIRPNFYAAMPLDRGDQIRRDAARLAALLRMPETRVLALWRDRHLINGREAPRPLWRSGAAAAELIATGGELVLLGLAEGIAHFTVDLSQIESEQDLRGLAGAGEFVDLRAVGPLIGRDEGAVMAYARAMLYWHRRHRFCAVCGAPSRSIHGGHVRRCTDAACATEHFPRTDPAVIVLVWHGEHALLGRQRSWLAGMHSTLAGFVEPGESLEEAVAREVREETGVTVAQPIYQSSQPWPFPASIMLGFRAEAKDMALAVDTGELESAAWYHRAELLASPENENFRLPRRDSIARRLIEDWLADSG